MGEIIAETNFATAENHFSLSLEITRNIKARNEEGITELNWGYACLKNNDINQSKEHLNKAKQIFEELKTIRYLEKTNEILTSIS